MHGNAPQVVCTTLQEKHVKSNSPVFVPISTAVINDATMPPALFRSFVRLYAAAQKHNFRYTDPLDFETELIPLLGLRRTQVRQHLRLLRFAKLLDWQTDGDNHYTIRFLVSVPHKSEKTDSGVVLVLNNNPQDIQSLQQQTKTAETSSPIPDKTVPQPVEAAYRETKTYRTVMHYLLEAGVWTEVAERIAQKFVENETRGHPYLPTAVDILGWIAYCFVDQEINKIQNPVTVLVANLKANRRCPQAYHPEPVCTRCERAKAYCRCPEGPALGYPPSFLEFALGRRKYNRYKENRWGICHFCHAYVCKCYDDDDDNDAVQTADAEPDDAPLSLEGVPASDADGSSITVPAVKDSTQMATAPLEIAANPAAPAHHPPDKSPATVADIRRNGGAYTRTARDGAPMPIGVLLRRQVARLAGGNALSEAASRLAGDEDSPPGTMLAVEDSTQTATAPLEVAANPAAPARCASGISAERTWHAGGSTP
jgi:hypothetical protein